MLYLTMARVLQAGSSVLGPLQMLSEPIQLGLNYWERRSEFSADRAGAVVMGGPIPMIETMIRLSGGPKCLTKDVNLDLYLAQAEAYDQLRQGSRWDKMLQNLAIMNASHPFPAVRAREIRRWCDGEQFQRLMNALKADSEAAPASGPRCPSCKALLQPDWRFCMHCGAPLPPATPTFPS
jgi:Zn-dependent protease with chaperone function